MSTKVKGVFKLERKIGNDRKINFSREIQAKLKVHLNSDLGINLHDNCFTVEKFDEAKTYNEKINIVYYNKIIIPEFIFLTLDLKNGDTMYINFRNDKVVFGKTPDSDCYGLTDEKKRLDLIIETACKTCMESEAGKKHILNILR